MNLEIEAKHIRDRLRGMANTIRHALLRAKMKDDVDKVQCIRHLWAQAKILGNTGQIRFAREMIMALEQIETEEDEEQYYAGTSIFKFTDSSNYTAEENKAWHEKCLKDWEEYKQTKAQATQ